MRLQTLPPRGRRGGPAVALLAICVSLLPAASPSRSEADAHGEVGTAYGQPTAAAHSDGDRSFYLFGGSWGGPVDWIVRVDRDGTGNRMGARLPTPRYGAKAVWAGRYAYVFGGEGWPGITRQLVRYDPILDLAEVLETNTSAVSAAVWHEPTSSIYTFSGTSISRYTPATADWTPMPTQAAVTAAVTVGSSIFALVQQFNVLRLHVYDPVAGTLVPTSTLITSFSGMASDGQSVYIVERPTDADPRLIRHDPGTGARTFVGSFLKGSNGSGLAFDGRDLWIIQHPWVRYIPATGTFQRTPNHDLQGRESPFTIAPAVHNSTLYGLLIGTGWQTSGQRVFRMDPQTSVITVTSAAPPVPRFAVAGASDGRHVYFFGGVSSSGGSFNDILRYDPATDELVRMNATSNTLLRTGSAFWDGTRFIIVTYDKPVLPQSPYTPVLVRVMFYDPVTDTLSTAAPIFNRVVPEATAFDGRALYLFGLPRIIRYDPGSGDITTMLARFPKYRIPAAASWNGRHIYVFAGSRGAHVDVFGGTDRLFEEIWRYDPAADALRPMRAFTPGPINWPAQSVWTGSTVDVVAGPIYRYSPAPSPPLIVSAEPGAGAGEIDLAWRAPGARTHGSPVEAYTVWRDGGSADDTLLATVGTSTRATILVQPGESLRVRVRAVSADGASPPSQAVAVSALPASAPQRLAATLNIFSGAVDVEWQPPAAGPPPVEYAVYRAQPPSPPERVATVTGTRFSEMIPQWNLRRVYTVRAVVAGVEGPASSGAPSIALSAPGAPQSFTALPYRPHGYVALSWGRPDSDGGMPVTGYRIWRGTSPAALELWDEVPGSFGSYLDEYTPAGLYFYRVTATNPLGDGTPTLDMPAAGLADELLLE